MKPSSGESAPLDIKSKSESSREVGGICSSRSIPSGRAPVLSTSLPPCGSISWAVSVVFIVPAPHGQRVDRSLPTDARAKPARPEDDTASGASRGHLRRHETELLELRHD